MNAVIALGDQTINVLNSDFACICELQCTARFKPAGRNRKHYRLEERLELFIKRAVNKHARAGGRALTVPYDQMNSPF